MKHQEFRNRVAYARRLGELEVENVAMKLKIHRLARDNNRVVKKLHNLEEKHKDAPQVEAPSKQTQEEMQQMRDRCNETELENVKLKRIAKEFHYFVEDKKLYAIKGEKCPYNKTVSAMIGYAYCQECSSFLGVIEGLGVICKNRMAEAKVSLPADE